MRFSRQEYWSWLPCPSPGTLPEIEPVSLMSPALADGFFTTSATWEAHRESTAAYNKTISQSIMYQYLLGYELRAEKTIHVHYDYNMLREQEWSRS